MCLDIYRDPRLLPCKAGGHTVCKGCIDDLMKGASLTCPVCRAKHDIPKGGTTKFLRNIMAVGLVDSMCSACRSKEPKIMCTHCDNILCESCQSSHDIFSGCTIISARTCCVFRLYSSHPYICTNLSLTTKSTIKVCTKMAISVYVITLILSVLVESYMFT